MRHLVVGYQTVDQPGLWTTQGFISLAVHERLKLEFSGARYCVGFDPPNKSGRENCPHEALAVQGAQCLGCLDASHTRACVRCIGRMCNNPQRREKCVFQDHFVYLAYYTDDLVKVGVTRSDRFRQRIGEQGAIGAMAIAGAGGQDVRRIEHEIAEAGWRDRTNLLPLLILPTPERQRVRETLHKEYERVAARLPHLKFHQGDEIWMADHYPQAVQFPPRQIDPRSDPLTGIVEGVRGNYILVRNSSETMLCSLRALQGREILTTESEREGLAQGTLFG